VRHLALVRARLLATAVATVAASALLLSGATGTTPVAHADAPTVVGSTLTAGHGLAPGQALSSPDGGYQLRMQADGNLVLYPCGGGYCSSPLWALGTYGQPGNHLEMQADGNLVMYSRTGQPVWYTRTSGSGNSFTVQDDTNMVVYAAGGRAVWWSGYQNGYAHVAGHGVGDLRSLNGRYRLGTPGNTVDVQDNSTGNYLWMKNCFDDPRVNCSSTDGRLVLQEDGNLVWYQPGTNGGMVAVWSTGTYGMGPTNYAVMQDDGNFVLYDLHGTALWDSKGFTHR
jgi:hypothetical protein